MATAQSIINDAHAHIEVLPAGSTLGPDLSGFGLNALNRMLDGWTAEQIAINGQALQTVTLAGNGNYALTTRPVKIEAAWVTDAAGVEQLARLVGAREWAQIADKTRTGGFAEVLYWDAGIPTSNVWLTPKPNSGTLNLRVLAPITPIASLATTVTVATGVEQAIVYNLAVALAGSLGKPVPASVASLAAASKDALKTLAADIFGIPQSLATPVGAK